MKRYTNREIIDEIQNGKDDVLFYLSKRFFHTSRRWLIRNGCSDANTPDVFSNALVEVCKEIHQNKLSPNVDFENFFSNYLKEYYKNFKLSGKKNPVNNESRENEIVSSCF